MSARRTTLLPLIFLVLLLLLSAGYVVSYYALVERYIGLGNGLDRIEYRDNYRWGRPYAGRFYQPMNSLDRRLRPGYWRIEDMLAPTE